MKDAQHLSALESTFVALESREVPFVYSCVLEFDRSIPLGPLRAHLDSVIPGASRYRCRIEGSTLRGLSFVHDRSFRIEHHVDEVEVAAPGNERQLEQLAASLIAVSLPKDRPPWRIWSVRGLAGGRGAHVALFHHALADGIAGFRLLEHIFGSALEHDMPTPTALRPEALRALPSLLDRRNLFALARLLREGLRPAAQLGINPRHTGIARSFASCSVPMDALEGVEREFSATNNDVVLATVAGALRRLMRRRGIDSSRFDDVRAMVPVGRHPKGDQATSGNRVVLLLVPLLLAEADPVERLRRVTSITTKLKGSHMASAGDLLVALSETTTPLLLAGVLSLALWARAFNVLITNVRGPARPLSLLDAELTRIVPMVNLWPHQAIAIAVASYAGEMTFGVHVDRTVIPDVEQLVEDLQDELDALFRAAKSVGTRPEPTRSNRPRFGSFRSDDATR